MGPQRGGPEQGQQQKQGPGDGQQRSVWEVPGYPAALPAPGSNNAASTAARAVAEVDHVPGSSISAGAGEIGRASCRERVDIGEAGGGVTDKGRRHAERSE